MSALSSDVAPESRGRLPRHVGLIMDGNGRWAERRGLPRLAGHREGARAVRDVSRAARRAGLEALTLYAFSEQNWSRPSSEVLGLMELLAEFVEGERAELLENSVRLRAVGQLERLPRFVRAPLETLCRDSAAQHGMTLTLALSYGGREELLAAAVALAEQLRAQPELRADAALLESKLWTAGLPELDLVIRTSGEQRISNFMLWQLAYAELVFVEKPWPEFTGDDLGSCLREFARRTRRFGSL